MPPFTGTLASGGDWCVPAYAQDMLWIEGGGQPVQATGPRGQFALDAAPDEIVLAWGRPGGTPLAVWRAGEPVTWDGEVALAGFVERIHVLETNEIELVIAEIEGSLLPRGYPFLPTLEDMRENPFAREANADRPAALKATYPVVALADSIHADYLHHAMVSELSVDCGAALGPHEGGWHTLIGLPLLVERLSLLAPDTKGRLG
jgi:hypothetical protein